MNKLNSLLVLSFILLLLVSCGNKSNHKEISMNIDYVEGTTKTIKSGKAQEFFNVTEDKKQVIKITVTKESGSLNIKIFNTADETNIIYEGNEFPSDYFTVNVNDVGKYKILVTCEQFIGTYDFDYDLSI